MVIRMRFRLAAIAVFWLATLAPAFAQNPVSLPIVGVLHIADAVVPFPTIFRNAGDWQSEISRSGPRSKRREDRR
jgi:hypothetical protein